MFSAGNVVRNITEDGTGDIYYVRADSDFNTGITEINDPDGVSMTWDTNDLELVEGAQEVHESKPMELVQPSMRPEDIIVEFDKYIVSLIERARSKGCECSIYLKVHAYNAPGSTETKVDYIACCQYEEDVTSGDLTTSLDIAVRRHLENKALQVPAISHYK